MPKTSSIGSACYVGGFDISGDIGSISGLSTSRATIVDTGIDKSAMERLPGKVDGGLEYMAYFNDSVGRAHAVFSGLPTTDVGTMYCHQPLVGNSAACLVALQANYDPSRGADGSITFKVKMEGDDFGLEWGDQLTAGKVHLGGAAAGSVLDYGASVATTNFGLQAYLQVFGVVGTSATVAIQSSSDNAGDAYADIPGAVFAAATPAGSPQAQRIQTTRTQAVERYLRVNVTGTFSSLDFAVVVVRNLISVAF
jgi:hypothetical protein